MSEDYTRNIEYSIDEVSKLLNKGIHKCINDIDQESLQNILEELIESSEMSPGFLCVSAGGRINEATGLQLLFVGLKTTKEIVDSNSWKKVDYEPITEDFLLIAADLLITLGFEKLIDHHRIVTEVINKFGATRASSLNIDIETENIDLEKNKKINEGIDRKDLKTNCGGFLSLYRAAIEIGGREKDILFEIARNLAIYNCLKHDEPEKAEEKKLIVNKIANENRDNLKLSNYYSNL